MSELNNWLQHQEDEEFEEFKIKKGNERQTKAAMLAGLGLAVSLGAVAANGNEAKAEEQGLGVHDLLLCTYSSYQNQLFGSVVNDPESANDQEPVPDSLLDSGTSQKVYKGYIIKPYGELRVYKRINGQDIQVGVLGGLYGGIGFITDSGVAAVNGGNFAKITDTGTTLASELIGEAPLSGSYTPAAGFVFANYSDAQNKEYLGAISEEDILGCTDGNIPVASTIQVPVPATTKYSSGLDYDKSTGELVVAMNEGVITIDLTPFLDENGKLPYDFSLSGADFGQFVDFGLSTTGTLASNGYQYFVISGGQGIIMRTPAQIASTSQIPSDKFTIIDKSQLGNGGKIKSAYELVTGGIYIIFDGEQPPVVLHEDGSITVDPGDMTPFIKKCFVIPPEEQAPFDPPTDLCEGVTCPTPAEQCKQSVGCDPATGDCVEQNKTNGTTCNTDNNACTVGDACADGQCAAGTPKTCAEPAEQCKQSAGCDAVTGDCGVGNKPNGTPCNDGDANTSNDKCAGGICEGTPIVNPEPDVVEQDDTVEPSPEPSPESGDDADVVEQEDVVEQGEEIIEGEIAEVEPGDDVIEISPDEVDPTDGGGNDADVVEQKPEQEEDANEVSTGETDTSGDLAGDDADDVSSEKAGSDTPSQIDEETPGKTPGCSCDVSDTQRQQRGLKEMLSVFGLAALAVLGLRRKGKT